MLLIIWNLSTSIGKINRDNVFDFDYKQEGKAPIKGKLYVDICSGIDQIPQKCKDKSKTSVLFVANDEDMCVNLMATDMEQNEAYVLSKDDVRNGFAIKRKNSDFRVELQCKPEMDVPDYVLYDNYIAIQSKEACGSYNEAGRFFDNNKVISCLFLRFISKQLGVTDGDDLTEQVNMRSRAADSIITKALERAAIER